MVAAPEHLDRVTLQRRVIRTLVGSQILSGVGMASGIAVGALLAEDLSGTEALAGVGTTAQVLGTALLTIPVARWTAARGRRVGLRSGLALAFIGAGLVLAAAVVRSFPLFVVGMFLFGGGTTANNQTRYAAADLAAPTRRGRDLSTVVWATTIGSVAGPNLVGPGRALAHAVGLPELAGTFVFSLVGFVLAWLVVDRLLRPDPLLTARALDAAERARDRAPGDLDTANHDGSMRRGLAVVRANPRALQAMLVLALGHLVMVSVMVMTPIHMKHGHAELEVIGFVISVHILGMFALSPLASLLAARSHAGWSGLLLVALFLLGVGWSCTLVSGSTLLTSVVTTEERPAAQGLADVLMGLAGAGGGVAGGVVVGSLGYSALATGSAVVGVLVLVVGAARVRGSSTTVS
jgi:MFS family permease